MSNRREFLKLSLAVGTTGVLASCTANNEIKPENMSSGLLSGIIYSRKNPGMWKTKVGGHAPIVSVEGKKITVETKHGMSKRHYIVRHTIVSPTGKVLGKNTFSPDDADPISVFEIPAEYKGKELYVTSFCNKHDMWVETFTA